MDSAELIAAFRLAVGDEAAPYLWSDAEAVRYASDAQRMFCRLVQGIADSSSAMTTIETQVGEEFVDIDPLILKVRSVRRADGTPVELLNFEDVEAGAQRLTNDYGVRVSTYRLDDSTGPVKALVLGMDRGKARVLPMPAVAETLRLIVYRLPLSVITAADQAQELEIDEQHHEALLEWMKHLAFLKQDAETFDRLRAQEARQSFMAYCDAAKGEKERLEHKYRTVAYGGY